MKKTSEMERALKEQEELKKEVAILRKDLKDLNNQKKGIIDSIKVRNRSAEDFKSKRDKLNAKIQELKKERTEINNQIKELFTRYKGLKQEAPRKDFKKMEMELNRQEWRLQTSVLKVEKEDELVKRIEGLKVELKDFKELIELSKSIDAKKMKSKKIHSKILSNSKESQTFHEAFLTNIKEIRALESEIDKINKKKDESTSKLEELKKILREKKEDIDKLGKKIKEMEKKKQEKSVEELKKDAKLVYEKFKKGEKLSTEDLFLLQRFGQI